VQGGQTGGGGDGVGGQQVPQMQEGFVQQPAPSYQPTMDYTPISSAAQDGVLG